MPYPWYVPLLQAFVGLLGTLLGALIAWRVAVRIARQNLTFEMHKEFNGKEMSEHRVRAQNFVLQHRSRTFAEISSTEKVDDLVPIWNVMRFYHRLAVVVRHRRVSHKLVPELFGGVFVWWYEVCYRTMLLPTGWESAREIDWLYGWLKKRASKAQWERWQQVPMAELAKALKDASGTATAIPTLAVVGGGDAGSADHQATG
jgi:hypothetical protein